MIPSKLVDLCTRTSDYKLFIMKSLSRVNVLVCRRNRVICAVALRVKLGVSLYLRGSYGVQAASDATRKREHAAYEAVHHQP